MPLIYEDDFTLKSNEAEDVLVYLFTDFMTFSLFYLKKKKCPKM